MYLNLQRRVSDINVLKKTSLVIIDEGTQLQRPKAGDLSFIPNEGKPLQCVLRINQFALVKSLGFCQS